MPKTVNFVQDRRKQLSLAEEQDRKTFRIALYALFGVLGVFVIVAGAQFFFVFQLKQITEDQESTRKAILSQEVVEREYSVFAHKLTHLDTLWEERSNKQEAIAFFNSLFSDGTQVSAIAYTADIKVLTFRITADSVFLLNQVFETLDSPLVTEKFPSIVKSRLSRNDGAEYAMEVTVTLGENS